MGLRRETVNMMKEAGFLKKEIDDLNNARTPSNEKQDLDLIINSKPFAHMVEMRRLWWSNALKPKALGGQGLTYKEALKSLESYYVMKGHRRKKRDLWGWLKISYRPKDKIQSKKKFQEAITIKSLIGKALGRGYGERLKLKYAPKSMLKKCHFCRGTGSMTNLEGRQQLCLHCSGSGVERKRFI